MVLRILLLVLIVAFAAPAAAQSLGQQPGQSRRDAPRSATVQAGITHFDKGFYDLTPHGRREEAAAAFDAAIAAFDRELAVNPSSVDAHVYLARIYALRKNFAEAAAHYDKVSELEPFNVDVCVLAALAYFDAKQPDEARMRLVSAKDRTSDREALARLDEYIAKVDALKR